MKKIIFALFSFIVLNLLFVVNNCLSQWVQTNGPYGNGTIRCFAVSGNNVFGGSAAFGVFLSTNNGDTWKQTSMNNKYVLSLFASGTIIYAGTSGGPYFTSNNGQDWINIGNELTGMNIYGFALLGTNLFTGTDNGVYVSTNNGNSWSSKGLTNKFITSIVTNGTNIFAGTSDEGHQDSGVYISTNNGMNWTPAGLTHINIRTLVSTGNKVLAAGLNNYPNNSNIYVTTNNGGSWSVLGVQDSYLYSVGVSGNTWFMATNTPLAIGNRMYRSTNLGLSWHLAESGLYLNAPIVSIESNGSCVFAASDNRTDRTDVYRTTNNGDNWSVSNTGMCFKFVTSMASIGTNIFAGTYSGGVFSSSNSGDSWSEVNSGLPPDCVIEALAVSGTDLFAGVFASPSGIYKSTNNGNNWFASGLINHQINFITTSGNNVYAGGYGGEGGVFLSTNKGDSWSSIGLEYKNIWTLAVLGSSIFAGVNEDSLYRSTNNGVNWTPINNGVISNYVMSLTTVGTNIFAGTYGGGIYLSTNNGNNWAPVNNGLPNEYSEVNKLISSGSYIFAAILSPNRDFIYLSTNNGSTWLNKAQGFDTVISYIHSLLIANNYIFAGPRLLYNYSGDGKSVWRRSFTEIIGVQNISTDIPISYALFQNYPNPFNPATKIKYDIKQSGYVRLIIFDALGRKVETLVDEYQHAGTYETNFNASHYPSGVYFYKLTTNNFTETKRMLYLK